MFIQFFQTFDLNCKIYVDIKTNTLKLSYDSSNF